MSKLKRVAFAATASALILGSLVTPAFAVSGADVVVDPGQQVVGSFTKDFNGAPVPQVEFSGGGSISGGDVNTEVTGTISNDTLVWSLCVAPGDGSVRTGQ